MRPVPGRGAVAPAVLANASIACSTSWSGSVPGALGAERQVDDGVRAPADVDDGRGERLVHRDGAVAEAADAGAVAERLGERRAEDERDVLDRVVLVDVEVAGGADLEVEQAVVGERASRWS